jgi:aldehyde oxidoreductase
LEQGCTFRQTAWLRAQDSKLIPTVGDIPPITVRFVKALSPHGPFGAKGLEEAPLIPTPATIAYAIRHAVGINVTSLPILPHKLIQPH